jgi:hypothetical protein
MGILRKLVAGVDHVLSDLLVRPLPYMNEDHRTRGLDSFEKQWRAIGCPVLREADPTIRGAEGGPLVVQGGSIGVREKGVVKLQRHAGRNHYSAEYGIWARPKISVDEEGRLFTLLRGKSLGQILPARVDNPG